ncbi:MAG: alanine racemase [Candidatus Izimaplasma sp.]|nr:alanine racemase [Candidatus Izimaplasma bacterium]
MFKSYRKTQADILLDNLYDNYISVKKLISPKKIMPVVKANAYGHGAQEVTKYLYSKGVDHFAVSLLEEALELRAILPDIKLLCMGVIEGQSLHIAAQNSITITLTDFDQLEDLMSLDIPLTVHIKVDTGMHRLGFNTIEDILEVIHFCDTHPHIHLEGIYTHFATADCDEAYYKTQLKSFKSILDRLDYPFEMFHISNSSASIKYEKTFDFTTHVRLGISLYGCTLDKEITFLKPTMVLKTKISHIRELNAGDKVGYGITYTAKQNEIIGVLPIGYADGFIRKNQGGYVMINNKRYKIVGRICMDQTFIQIHDTVSKEDIVYLFGKGIDIDEVAKRLETINYEVLCGVSSRVVREYFKK